MGPPGSGKGTQSELLAEKLKIEHFSMGQALRDEIADKTAIGREIEPILARGALVSDKIVSRIIVKKIAKIKKGLILDGFPRKLGQAKMLDRLLRKRKTKNVFLEIHLPAKEVVERIGGRLDCQCGAIYHIKYKAPKKPGVCDVCAKKLFRRSDNKPSVVRNRLKSYNKETKPVLRFVMNKKNYEYHRIDGTGDIKRVFKLIQDAVK